MVFRKFSQKYFDIFAKFSHFAKWNFTSFRLIYFHYKKAKFREKSAKYDRKFSHFFLQNISFAEYPSRDPKTPVF